MLLFFIITFHREKLNVGDVHDPQQRVLNTCLVLVQSYIASHIVFACLLAGRLSIGSLMPSR